MKIFFKFIILILAIFIIVHTLRDVDFPALIKSFEKLHFKDLSIITLIVTLNFFVLSSYDVLANRYFDFKMPPKKVYVTAFMVYGISMNLGPLFGAVGLRFKLYRELGRSSFEVTKIILFSTLSNWLGFFILLTSLFIFFPANFSFIPFFQEKNFLLLGFLFWFLFLGLMSIFYFKGELKIRNVIFKKPKFDLVFKMLVCSLIQWSSQVYLLYFLIQKKTYLKLMAIYFLSSLGSLVSHIPGGVGIFESLIIYAIQREKEQVLLGLILFRGIYYFFPGIIAGFLFFIKSFSTRKNT